MADLGASDLTPELSVRQREALQALQKFQADQGYPPTRAELGRILGVSAQTADFHLRALKRKGYVRMSRHARGVTFVPVQRQAAVQAGSPLKPDVTSQEAQTSLESIEAEVVPVLGRVAAGRPLFAIENLERSIPLPKGCGVDFALGVRGDSMIEAGILDGDLVLVKQAKTARRGDIVVALLGEGDALEATVKRYIPERGRVVLRPENDTMSDIVVKRGEGFSLAGKVVGVLRLWK